MFQPNYKLILASGSPRRQELLKQSGFNFEIRLKQIEENYPSDLPKKEIASYLAQLKANAFKDDLNANELLITADTVVVLGNEELQKPQDFDEAFTMLNKLSGNTHQVITGVCLRSKEKEVVFSDTTNVQFLDLTKNEIESYLEEYKPYDKAGSYGIQEWIGMLGIERIEGSFYNVMGLPLHALYQQLKMF